jgi:dolichol kinase
MAQPIPLKITTYKKGMHMAMSVVTKELCRQIIHIILGVIIAFSVLYFGKVLIYPLFILVIIGIFLYFYLKEHYIPIISDLLAICGREDEGGKGAVLFAIGLLITLIVVKNINSAFYSILVFAIGDGLATIVGVKGNLKIKYFGKTIEGFLAFFISAGIILYSHYGIYGIIIAFISACIEFISKKTKVDDNLILPIIVGLILETINNSSSYCH